MNLAIESQHESPIEDQWSQLEIGSKRERAIEELIAIRADILREMPNYTGKYCSTGCRCTPR